MANIGDGNRPGAETFAGIVQQDAAGRVPDKELDHLAHVLAANLRISELREGWKLEYVEAERRVSANIRDQRLRQDVSQEQLAQLMHHQGFDLHQSTIAKMEAGKRPLRVAELFAFADALSVPWMSLLQGGRDIDVLPDEGMIPLDVWEAGLEELVLKREDAMSDLTELVESRARAYADWDRMILVRVSALSNAAARARKNGDDIDVARVDELIEKWQREASYWAAQREDQDSPEAHERLERDAKRLVADRNAHHALAKEFLEWRSAKAAHPSE